MKNIFKVMFGKCFHDVIGTSDYPMFFSKTFLECDMLTNVEHLPKTCLGCFEVVFGLMDY